jgi:broad specificity phosphatase PhoE
LVFQRLAIIGDKIGLARLLSTYRSVTKTNLFLLMFF